MSITTSCFSLSGKNPLAVAISNGTRGYPGVKTYKALAPPWALVKQLDETIFRIEYMKQLNGMNAHKVIADLRALTNSDDTIMLCWEQPGVFCHRRITAFWLERELGIVVPELDVAEPPKSKGKSKSASASASHSLF
jgi:hypothetical protein